jgi:hypothetical protein
MKTRQGFVSNSSSSSFIVITHDFCDKKNLLSKKEINKLLKHGFKHTFIYFPIQLEEAEDKPYLDKADEWSNLGYSVACNENEVIEFLLKNNIAFNAVRHYGHESIFFEKDSDKILFVKNTGLEFEMYGFNKDTSLENRVEEFKNGWGEGNIFRIMTVKEYLENC